MGIADPAQGATSVRYAILGKLATGGMAELFLARASSFGGVERHVVLKRVLPRRLTDPQFATMFLDEARLAGQLHHNNIAQVHDIGRLGESYFFTMEYVHGEDVRAIMARLAALSRRMPISHVLHIAAGIAAGLHYAHERTAPDGRSLGIVHRDVSPANVMVSFDGAIKLVDFGVAKAALRTVQTQAGAVKGKVSYLSPEQCRGRPLDRRSDIFSLGILLHEMLTGSRLFRRGSDYDTMQAIVTEPVAPPSHSRSEISPALDRVVMTALAKDPDARFRTAGDLLEQLETIATRDGWTMSTAGVGRFLRELFGDRPEPWIELNQRDDQPSVITVTSASVQLPRGVDDHDSVEIDDPAVEAQLKKTLPLRPVPADDTHDDGAEAIADGEYKTLEDDPGAPASASASASGARASGPTARLATVQHKTNAEARREAVGIGALASSPIRRPSRPTLELRAVAPDASDAAATTAMPRARSASDAAATTAMPRAKTASDAGATNNMMRTADLAAKDAAAVTATSMPAAHGVDDAWADAGGEAGAGGSDAGATTRALPRATDAGGAVAGKATVPSAAVPPPVRALSLPKPALRAMSPAPRASSPSPVAAAAVSAAVSVPGMPRARSDGDDADDLAAAPDDPAAASTTLPRMPSESAATTLPRALSQDGAADVSLLDRSSSDDDDALAAEIDLMRPRRGRTIAIAVAAVAVIAAVVLVVVRGLGASDDASPAPQVAPASTPPAPATDPAPTVPAVAPTPAPSPAPSPRAPRADHTEAIADHVTGADPAHATDDAPAPGAGTEPAPSPPAGEEAGDGSGGDPEVADGTDAAATDDASDDSGGGAADPHQPPARRKPSVRSETAMLDQIRAAVAAEDWPAALGKCASAARHGLTAQVRGACALAACSAKREPEAKKYAAALPETRKTAIRQSCLSRGVSID